MNPENNMDEPAPTCADPKVIPPTLIAVWEATIAGLSKLSTLAKAGDPDALEMYHYIASTMVQRLNERHLDYAASVLEWPVLLPQNRDARKAVTKRANEMRIGSVKAGGKGRPEILAYSSEKGFAIINLQRMSEARSRLRKAGYDGLDSGIGIKDYGFLDPWPGNIEFMDPKFLCYLGSTEIETTDPSLLLKIRDLPEYTPKTKIEWIRVMFEILESHPHLVPDSIANREATRKKEHLPDGRIRKYREQRGGVLRKVLADGLKNVSAIPGKWGD